VFRQSCKTFKLLTNLVKAIKPNVKLVNLFSLKLGNSTWSLKRRKHLENSIRISEGYNNKYFCVFLFRGLKSYSTWNPIHKQIDEFWLDWMASTHNKQLKKVDFFI
jgi:hypothetical protein